MTPTVRPDSRTWRISARDQRRLADAGRAGDADHERLARLRIELAHELVGERVAVLDERDRAGERPAVARADAVGELLEAPRAAHVRPSERPARDACRPRMSANASPAAVRKARLAQPHTQRAPKASVSGPATAIAEREHRVVRRHDHRERAAAQLVGRAALDEQRVADDRRAVAERRRRPRPPPPSRRSARTPRLRSRAPSDRSRARTCAPCRLARSQAPAARLPRVSPRPPAPTSTPKPTLPASSETFARTTWATLIPARADLDDVPGEQHGQERRATG